MNSFGDKDKSKKSNSKNSMRSFKAVFDEALKLHSAGKISDAIKNYNFLLNSGFNDPQVFANYGNILKGLGKLKDAKLSYQKAIDLKPDFAELHSNYGTILRDLGKLKDAELSYQKAIDLKPDFPELHFNLGSILKDLGKLKDAELSFRKAIDLKPDFARAYFSLSSLKSSKEDLNWIKNLFSKNIFKKLNNIEKIDIYFARANIFHREKNYKKSTQNLQLANNLKLEIYKSNSESLITKSKNLLIASSKEQLIQNQEVKSPKSIFIVGMPRCGSTLVESILSMNNSVIDLGEINLFEKAFLIYKKKDQSKSLSEIYFQEIKNLKGNFRITTNKWLYNYQYSGVILNNLPNAKIIHCFRHPLDNILSISRANFARGNSYSSSLEDCAKVYLDQEQTMRVYKQRFRSSIYDLNYDLLVNNPKQIIKNLIDWLKWEWQETYLSPHLNKRSVLTASNVEIRSPINSRSIGGWKNYKDMLTPAIEILKKNERYKDIL